MILPPSDPPGVPPPSVPSARFVVDGVVSGWLPLERYEVEFLRSGPCRAEIALRLRLPEESPPPRFPADGAVTLELAHPEGGTLSLRVQISGAEAQWFPWAQFRVRAVIPREGSGPR